MPVELVHVAPLSKGDDICRRSERVRCYERPPTPSAFWRWCSLAILWLCSVRTWGFSATCPQLLALSTSGFASCRSSASSFIGAFVESARDEPQTCHRTVDAVLAALTPHTCDDSFTHPPPWCVNFLSRVSTKSFNVLHVNSLVRTTCGTRFLLSLVTLLRTVCFRFICSL
ncbi:uncharacterized protein LAESUDRAFT_723732, partial [Laetiporus sulphureus 93-53]